MMRLFAMPVSMVSHFKWDGNNMVTARSREVIVEIEQSVADWSARLSRLEKEPLTEFRKMV